MKIAVVGSMLWLTTALAGESPSTDQLAYLGPYPGERRPAPPLVEEKPAEREWIGQPLPWWNWSRLTGDWQYERTKLATNGLTFGGKYISDSSVVLAGGLRRRGVIRGLLDLNVTFDTQPLLGIEGGTFFAQYYLHHGPNGNDDVGSLQGYSSIDEERFSRAEEVWYEQKLFHDKLRVKVGQVDANAEFDLLPAAGEFISPSGGHSPNIVGMPTYPCPALSLNVFVYPLDWFYCGAGVYTKNFRELSSHSFDHPFVIGEAGVTHKGFGRLGPGRLAIGGWHHTDNFGCFDGSITAGTSGFFVAAEQQVWKETADKSDDAQGISLFVQYARADADVSETEQHIGFGVSALGLLPTRDDDSLGLYCSCALTSRAGAGFDRDEHELELYYNFKLTPFCSLKPDLQWIQHPGGQSNVSDALVATLRVTVTF